MRPSVQREVRLHNQLYPVRFGECCRVHSKSPALPFPRSPLVLLLFPVRKLETQVLPAIRYSSISSYISSSVFSSLTSRTRMTCAWIPRPLCVEMHVTRVTVVWVSIENPIEQHVDNAPPGTPIDIWRTAPRTVSLRDCVDKVVGNRTSEHDGDLAPWSPGRQQRSGCVVGSRRLPAPKDVEMESISR